MSVINLSMGTGWTAPLGLTFTTRLARWAFQGLGIWGV